MEVPIDVLDSRGNTPLDDALFARNFGAVEILFLQTKKFYPGKYNKHYKNYPLHIAATCPKIELTENFLLNGAKVYALDQDGNTPLHIALQCNNDQIALLLATGTYDFEIDKKNNKGETPLLLATRLIEAREIIQLLIDKGAKIDEADNEGNTPFYNYFHERNALIDTDVSILGKYLLNN